MSEGAISQVITAAILASGNNTEECDLPFDQVDFHPPVPCSFNYTPQCQLEWTCEVLHYYHDDLQVLREIVYILLRYGTLTIIILGVLMNILSFYVLHSSGLSKNGSGIYLVALAFCDSGNLILNFATGIARAAFPSFNHLFMEHDWLCRFHSVFVELFQLTTSWIVVAFTIERCLMIWRPMAIMKNKVKRSRIILASIIAICVSISLTKLFLQGFEKDSVFGYVPCGTKAIHWEGVGYIRIALQTWLPTLAIFSFNCLILYKLEKIKRNRLHLTSGFRVTSNSTKSQTGSIISNFARPTRTTPMLVAVSLAYLVLVLPLGLVQTIEFYWQIQRPSLTQSPSLYTEWKKTRLLLKLLRCMCFCFYQINFCINFFLYFITGVQFRLHLMSKISQFRSYLCQTKTKTVDRQASACSSSARTVITTFSPACIRGNDDDKIHPLTEDRRPQ